MKKRNLAYLFISLLEGMLSGGYFYLGRRDRDPLQIATGCTLLVLSFFHGLLSVREEEEHILLVEEEDYE